MGIDVIRLLLSRVQNAECACEFQLNDFFRHFSPLLDNNNNNDNIMYLAHCIYRVLMILCGALMSLLYTAFAFSKREQLNLMNGICKNRESVCVREKERG